MSMIQAVALAVVVGVLVAWGMFALGRKRGFTKAVNIFAAQIETAREDAAAARTAAAEQTVAAAIAMRDDEASRQLAAELRADLKDSERKRLEVGACIGQVIDERKTYEDLYVSMMTGCSRAQHWLSIEIERLSKLSGRPISPQVLQVIQETKGLMAQEPPPATSLPVMQAKIAAVTAAPAEKAPSA